MRALLVDDNTSVRRLLHRMLQPICAEVAECDDGEGAAEAYERNRPDIVLMDVKMARVDGLTATRRILAIDPSARVLIVTEYDDAAMRDAAHSSGACGYVVKGELSTLPEIVRALARSGNPAF